MTWYYVAGNQQQGPVDDAERQRLALEGIITDNTLVWREGFAEWRPHGEVTGTTPPPARSGVACSLCGRGFPADQTVRIEGRFVCAECKPTALQQMREGVNTTGESEAIRQAHIKHEASVKSVGVLYFLGAAFLLLIGVVSMVSGDLGRLAMGALFCLLAAGQLVVGIGLRGLKSWARIPTGILSGIGLIGFPLGTLINGYILYLVFCQKGATVFSDDYKRVIAETPHIKYRTSIVVWILLGLVVALIAVGLMVSLFATRR
jgi:hypothetical protein